MALGTPSIGVPIPYQMCKGSHETVHSAPAVLRNAIAFKTNDILCGGKGLPPSQRKHESQPGRAGLRTRRVTGRDDLGCYLVFWSTRDLAICEGVFPLTIRNRPVRRPALPLNDRVNTSSYSDRYHPTNATYRPRGSILARIHAFRPTLGRPTDCDHHYDNRR